MCWDMVYTCGFILHELFKMACSAPPPPPPPDGGDSFRRNVGTVEVDDDDEDEEWDEGCSVDLRRCRSCGYETYLRKGHCVNTRCVSSLVVCEW